MTSASSLWPLPATAAMPTISPARTSSETPRRAGTPLSPSASICSRASTVSPGGIDVRSRLSRISRPTISVASWACVAPAAGSDAAVTFPRRMTVIRSAIARTSPSLWLMNTTLRPAAVIDRSVRNRSSISCGRQDRRRLVHDQDPGAAVQDLEDLDPLSLADGQLPDPRPRVDAQAVRLGKPADLRVVAAEIEPEAGPIEADDDVLGDGHRRDQREVLMDHPEAGRDRIPRGAERHRPPVEEDLPGIGLVQPVEDVHQRALPGAVLAEQGMDLAGREVEVDAVVGDDARGTA